MNLKTIDKEFKYYTEKPRIGTSNHYNQSIINMGCLTFSVYIFKDRAYKEHGKPSRFHRKSSKIPRILFNRYKFGILKNIN